MDQALDTRDAVAKALYSGLFTWLVDKVNSMVKPNSKRLNGSIALLDIFGFEELALNSFEQLCINYANERLHFYFNLHIFKIEQAEYAREGIDWKMITFNDNQGIIDLISRKPHGIIHLLDDESNFPQGSDSLFLEKCHFQHSMSKFYDKPRVSGPCFNIFHYAGKVTYNVQGFLEKNRDILRNEVIELLIKSKNRFISTMISDWKEKQIDSGKSKFTTMKPRTPTIAAGFHTSLGNLIEAMSKCHPFFVRCVKPNNDKIPMSFDSNVVLDQLRYTGMLETIRIRKEGFSVRITFDVFVQRYHALLIDGPKSKTQKELCKIIMNKVKVSPNSWQLGHQKILMKESTESAIEKVKNRITFKAIVNVQKIVKGFLERKRFKRKYKAVILVQKFTRYHLAR